VIEESNYFLKQLWTWQANRKLNSKDVPTQYTSLYVLGAFGSYKHVEKILPFLLNSVQLLRNRASKSLKLIYHRLEEIIEKASFEKDVYNAFEKSESLIHKLSLLEVIREFSLQKREEFLGPLINQAEDDLLYIVIRSLSDTKNFDLLDAVLESANTHDLILRKTALKTWYEGIKLHEVSESLAYCTPRLHYMIRAAYELQTEGGYLKELLSHASLNELPSPKAYPDFIIRYFTELLGKWEYDPDAYRSLHGIVVPSYFTFEETGVIDEDQPFIIL
jgi:hypothetical protein